MADFARTPVKCLKCGSTWMEEKQVKEMFVSPYKGHLPLYSGATMIRIYCADCGTVVWVKGKFIKGYEDLKPMAQAGKE